MLVLVLGVVLLVLWLISTIAALVGCAFIGLIVISSAWMNHRMRRIAASRHGENICTFARAFNLRVVDPWVVRAVYEEVQGQFGKSVPYFPVRATDRLAEDLGIVDDDLDDLAQTVAERTGRSLERAERNPVTKISTTADLVHFLNYQVRNPRSLLRNNLTRPRGE